MYTQNIQQQQEKGGQMTGIYNLYLIDIYYFLWGNYHNCDCYN
jgi:hypothetical protein